MTLERVCDARAGPPILIQHYQNRESNSISTRWWASSWRETVQGEAWRRSVDTHPVYITWVN